MSATPVDWVPLGPACIQRFELPQALEYTIHDIEQLKRVPELRPEYLDDYTSGSIWPREFHDIGTTRVSYATVLKLVPRRTQK